MIKIILYIAIFLTFAYAAEAQFIQNNSRSLFSDVKAFQKNDAIMVLIMEEMIADNGASTGSGRSSSVNGGLNLGLGSAGDSYDVELGTGNDHSSRANTTRNERIRSQLSARVINVEANGNLEIEGKRTTKINGETQTVIIRGIVRPVDVLPDNSVYSYNVLDLTLLIEGDGTISEVQEPGLITKFLRILF